MPMKRRREIIVPSSILTRLRRAETRATLVAAIAPGRRWLDEIVAGAEGGLARPSSPIGQGTLFILAAIGAARAFNTLDHIPIPRVGASGGPSYSPDCGFARCLCGHPLC